MSGARHDVSGDADPGAEPAAAPRSTHTGELAALLELSPDAVLVVDVQGEIRDANAVAGQLFRCRENALVGSPVEELVPEHLRSVHRRERAIFAEAPSRRSMGSGRRLRARRCDATTFPVDISLRPISVDGESLVVAVVRDLTAHDQLRRHNEQLAHDASNLRRFIDVASHELRTPLTSVLGFAETLQRHPDLDDTERAELVDRLVRNARREEALISALLDVSRLRNGRLPLEVAPVDLAATVDEVVGAFGEVEIRRRVRDGTVVLADQLRLEQILTNLLANAVRHGAEPIEVAAGPVTAGEAHRASIVVTDHGPGVDAAFEPELFQAFSQQDGAGRPGDASRLGPGLGLGLHLTRELVAAMGGTIVYRPNTPTGSRFEVQLPTSEVSR